MSTVKTFAMIGGLTLVWVATTGCISKDEYLRVESARRNALAHSEALECDLVDERNRTLALETERESLRRELDAKTALGETLQAENGRLDLFAQKLQTQMDAVLAKGVGDIQVVEVKLPPELDRALQDFAARYPETIEYDPHLGAVRWKSDLTFAVGSDEVRESAKASLRAFAEIVNSPATSQFDVVIVGHTDNLRIGPVTARKHPTNWHLSVHRAVSVMFALSKSGVDSHRLGCMGYGEFRPRQPNPPRGGSEANRRVEIYLVSSKDRVPGMQAASANTDSPGAVASTDNP